MNNLNTQVAYFTAIFPYIVLLVLIIQSALLNGAADGIKYYVIPKWNLVAKFEVKIYTKNIHDPFKISENKVRLEQFVKYLKRKQI